MHLSIAVVGQGAVDLIAFLVVSTWRCHVHPVAITGIVGTVEISADGTYGECSFVVAGRTEIRVLVTGCKDDQATRHRAYLVTVFIHTGVGVEIIDGHLVGVGDVVDSLVAPTVLGDDGPMVGTPLDGAGAIGAALLIFLEDLGRHEPDTLDAFGVVAACNAADAFAVIIHSSNCSGHMGAVIGLEDVDAVVHEIESMDSRAVGIVPQVGG